MKIKLLALFLLISAISISLISCDFLGGGDGDGGGDIGDGGGGGPIEGVYYCPDGDHNFDSWYTIEDATCTMEGSKTRSCTSCSYFEEETIPAKGHNVYTKSVENPTCYEDGVKIEGCRRSGCDYEKITVISGGHIFGDWYESKSPLCEEPGEETRECIREGCDHVEVREGADALDHVMSDWHETKAPTCEDSGEEARECTREGCNHLETREIPSLGGHTLGDWYETKAPLCDKAGEERTDCQREGCDHFETRATDPIGEHAMGDWYIAQNPSCIRDGLYRKDCEREGCIYYETEKIPATGEHSYGYWYETLAPTCTYAGEKRRDCSTRSCESFEVEKIDMLPHSEVSHEGKAPTCTESGWAEYVTCEKCDYTTYEHLAMRHTFEGGICIACGEREPSAYLVYTLSDDGTYYILTGSTRSILGEEIVIASLYNGLPVKEIMYIGNMYDDGVKRVYIPKTITKVYQQAFEYYRRIEEVHIQDLKAWCNIEFGIGSSSPLRNGARLYVNGEQILDLVIPDTITEIQDYAFHGASGIKSVTIGDNVTKIGEYAFYRCADLREIYVGKTVRSIADSSFQDCNGINTVYYNAIAYEQINSFLKKCNSHGIDLTIGKDVLYINQNLFRGDYLNSITFEDNSSCISIGEYAFAENRSIFSVTIPESVKEIASNAFYDCVRLVEVYNLSELEVSGENFFGCTPYAINTSRDVPSRIYYDLGHVFYLGYPNIYIGYISGGETMIIPENCKGNAYEFHPHALIKVGHIKKLVVPDVFESLPEGIFGGFTGLEEIILPFVGNSNSASRHEGHFGYIFGYTTRENSKDFPYHYYDKTTKLYYRYYIPQNLKTVVIEGDKTVIHDNSFQNCSITTITFGENVKYIGKDVFVGCGALQRVNLMAINMVSSYSNYTSIFQGAGAEQIGITLYVGNKVESIESYLFYGVKNLISISFAKDGSLKYIGTCAFYGTRVSKVELPVGVSLGTSAFNSDVVITQ